jgi:hypothetical protein
MSQDAARTAVRATLVVLDRLARRTRTPADNLMAQMLRANEDRLVEVVATLMASPTQPPTEEEVGAALKRVGIDA